MSRSRAWIRSFVPFGPCPSLGRGESRESRVESRESTTTSLIPGDRDLGISGSLAEKDQLGRSDSLESACSFESIFPCTSSTDYCYYCWCDTFCTGPRMLSVMQSRLSDYTDYHSRTADGAFPFRALIGGCNGTKLMPAGGLRG